MNGRIAGAGAWIATVSVILFAACMLIPFDFGSYFVCMVLPIGYIMMCGGFYSESHEQRRAAAMVGMVFAAIYAALIFLVYFAQLTTVRLDALEGQAVRVLDFSRGGLLFNYDLLGYGMMALSTFFVGLTIEPRGRAVHRVDKVYKMEISKIGEKDGFILRLASCKERFSREELTDDEEMVCRRLGVFADRNRGESGPVQAWA